MPVHSRVMETHPKIEALQSHRDLLSAAARSLDSKIEQAMDELHRADAAVAELEACGVHASAPQAVRVREDRQRRADKLELLRARRKVIDADRARCGQTVERLAKWWKQNGGEA